ncbi:MAG TPA: GNAT family N-acetyltransferase [Burkholderiales bacterium]|nr:GNAT family N-acetyltransferase [Burkholderiales bacterium]
MEIIRITDDNRQVVEPAWLERAERVHRQLRPQLAPDYVGKMQAVFGSGGEMCIVAEGALVVGVAVFRYYENTFSGRKFYVDDLVTDEAFRSGGIGHAMLAFLEKLARARGCDSLELDSGTQRTRAHKFYFREGFVIPAFVFRKDLR